MFSAFFLVPTLNWEGTVRLLGTRFSIVSCATDALLLPAALSKTATFAVKQKWKKQSYNDPLILIKRFQYNKIF